MKKILLSLVAGLLLTGTIQAQETAKSVAGTYTGTLTSIVGDKTYSWKDQTLIITASATSDSVVVTIPKFAVDNVHSYGTLDLVGMTVKKSGTKIYFNTKYMVDVYSKDSTFNAGFQPALGDAYILNDSVFFRTSDNYWYNGSVAGYEDFSTFSTNFIGAKTVTGISSISANATKTNAIYSISGVRMPATSVANLPKGIYIVNGKKVIK